MRDPVLDFLISRRVMTGDCWVWTGARDTKGYGRVWLEGHGQSVHRVAFERARGRSIPKGLVLDHACRNRACFNPDHLEQVTNRENIRRGHEYLVK